MNRLVFAASLISILFLLINQTIGSEEEHLQWQSVRVECVELEPIGKVILTAQVNDNKFGSLEVTVFGRTHTLEPEKLAKLEGFPLSSLSITHEAGYEKLGGYTLSCKFKRLYYNDDKDLIEENAVISFFMNKPKDVSVIIQSKTINKGSEQANFTESEDNNEAIKPTLIQMLDAVITRPIKGENFPVLPVLSTEMRSKVINKLFESETIRELYSKLDARKSNIDWFEGISELEKLKAVWPLLSALCHYSDDVQIYALRSLHNIGDKQVVPFLLIYAEYMAVYEEGSENATIHGIIHTEIAKTLSTLTGIEVKIDGQNPEKLKEGIHLWQKWQIQQEEKK